MVEILCTRLHTAIEVERSHELYANLKSMLILLEMEQFQDYKAEKNKNFHLSNKISDYDHLLRQGMICLGMIQNFNNWFTPNSTKNTILIKTLNVFGRVRFQYKRMIHMRNQLLNGIIDNDIREDIIIGFDNANFEFQENNELKIDIDALDEYDIDEYEVIDFYDWQSNKKKRTVLQRMINSLINKLHHAIIKRYFTLYSITKKYCCRASQFLHNNKKILKSSKLRRRHGQKSCCKYHFLKHLIACLSCLIAKLYKVKTNDILRNIII